MSELKICRERFRSLLRFGRKNSGSWDDECGCENCFMPDDDDCDALCDAYERTAPSPEEVERLVEDLIHYSAVITTYILGMTDESKTLEDATESFKQAKSRLLAAFSNTPPYLSGDVKGWLPIETAPKDGTRVKLLTQGGKEDIGYWSNYPRYNPDDLPGEWSTEFGNCDTPITHWMPLPEPPRKAGE